MIKSENIIFQVINLTILLMILIVFCWVFIDTRKQGGSIGDSLLWGIISLFFYPPIGLLIYLFYKRKKWL